MQLDTKVRAFLHNDPVGLYTVHIEKEKDYTLLTIRPTKGTAGEWSWKLEGLLQIDNWAEGQPSDILVLDIKQDWFVAGMLRAYREIINNLVG